MSAGAIAENLFMSSTQEKNKVAQATKNKNDVSKDAFMKLLVAQMTHQDPLSPMKNQEFMSQLAQLQALDEQRSMTANVKEMTGTMKGLRDDNKTLLNQLMAVSGNTEVLLSLESMRLENQIANASSMVGHTIDGVDANGINVSGVVESVNVSNTGAVLNLVGAIQVPMQNVVKVI